jgi:hypothetical protein
VPGKRVSVAVRSAQSSAAVALSRPPGQRVQSDAQVAGDRRVDVARLGEDLTDHGVGPVVRAPVAGDGADVAGQ